MSGGPGSVWLVLGSTLLAVVLLMAATALWSRAVGRVSVVDVVWGAGFGVLALVAALTGTLLDAGDPGRRWLLPALVLVWGLRLAWHIQRRSAGGGHAEDPRYAELLGDGGFGAAVRKVFAVQGAAMWLIALPVTSAAVLGLEPGWGWPVLVAGVLVWAAGLAFEAVGDAQLAAYRREPKESRPPVMDRGLWAWTRHPNYFGDSLVWWGLWLAGGLASGWLPGLLTVVSPLVMTHFLRNVSGARLLERTMSRRPGWEEYAARTPYFFPRPPRRS